MGCKFAIKYPDKRSFLAKVYQRLTSSVQNPEVVEFTNLLSNHILIDMLYTPHCHCPKI